MAAKELLRRRDIMRLVPGIGYRYIDRLLTAGALQGVRFGGRGRRWYPRAEVERVFQIKVV